MSFYGSVIAYEVLTDAKKRKVYDLYGEEGLKENGSGGPSFDFNDLFGQGNGFGFNFDNIFDIFGEDDDDTDVGTGGFFDSFSPFGNMGGFGMPQGIVCYPLWYHQALHWCMTLS